MASLHPRLGIVVVDGHAEPSALRADVFRGLNLIHLRNTDSRFTLPNGQRIRIVGFDVHAPDLELLDVPKPKNEILIVASHVPDVTTRMIGKNVDLHVAGHTHGGQIVLPGYGALLTLSSLPRQYARGLRTYEDHLINVTAGIGMEGNYAPRLRLFCPPEVVLITIQSREIPQ